MQNYKELLLRFFNEINSLNPNVRTLIYYDRNNGQLEFIQPGNHICVPYISHLYHHKYTMKYGILFSEDLNDLKNSLHDFILVHSNDPLLTVVPTYLGTSFYTDRSRQYKNLHGPMKILEFNYISTTNQLVIWFIKKKDYLFKTTIEGHKRALQINNPQIV